MAKAKAKRPNASASNSTTNACWYGPPPIIRAEEDDKDLYDKFLARVFADVQPRDCFEEMLCRDVVDQTWEIKRLRQIKTYLVEQDHREVRLIELSEFGKNPESELRELPLPVFTEMWINIDNAALAKAYEARLEFYERLDRYIATKEARRNAAIREIDRHRFMLARNLRESVQRIEDADFRTIEVKSNGKQKRKPARWPRLAN